MAAGSRPQKQFLLFGTQATVISPEELARLLAAHGPALELLARARCRWPEDCVQEAFIQLASQSEAPTDPVAWLARAVRNRAIDFTRADGRRIRHERQCGADRKGWFEPFSKSQNAVSSEKLEACLKQLNIDDREIITAHIWGGMSFRQLTEVFDQSSSALHRRYQTALTRLRTLLDSPSTNT